MSKRKICVVTGTRAEYGLLYWLMKEIQGDKELELQLIVTGMHLSPEFGLTYKEIEKEFKIDKKIEMLLSSDTAVGITKSIGLAQISFAEVYEELKPDFILVLGDRYEIFSAVSVAMISKIPIIHLHGGEITEGAFDESIRHSISKMSHIHFTATEEYKKRVIQLGENPNRVFNVGGLGVHNIKKMKLLNRKEFEKSIDFKLNKQNLLVTFHPVTLEKNSSQEQFQEILNALNTLENTNIIFTKANSDINGRVINRMINEYTLNNKNTVSFDSLGQLRYLSSLQYIDAVIGNSSSGLLEVPSFKKATINIGDRQKGRISSSSVIDCKPLKQEILDAIKKVYFDENFKKELRNTINPYEKANVISNIINNIKKIKSNNLLKKKFHDL